MWSGCRPPALSPPVRDHGSVPPWLWSFCSLTALIREVLKCYFPEIQTKHRLLTVYRKWLIQLTRTIGRGGREGCRDCGRLWRRQLTGIAGRCGLLCSGCTMVLGRPFAGFRSVRLYGPRVSEIGVFLMAFCHTVLSKQFLLTVEGTSYNVKKRENVLSEVCFALGKKPVSLCVLLESAPAVGTGWEGRPRLRGASPASWGWPHSGR